MHKVYYFPCLIGFHINWSFDCFGIPRCLTRASSFWMQRVIDICWRALVQPQTTSIIPVYEELKAEYRSWIVPFRYNANVVPEPLSQNASSSFSWIGRCKVWMDPELIWRSDCLGPWDGPEENGQWACKTFPDFMEIGMVRGIFHEIGKQRGKHQLWLWLVLFNALKYLSEARTVTV